MPTMDPATGLYMSRCVNCGNRLWERNGQWADSPVKGLSGNPLVLHMICPAKVPAPLKHVAEVDAPSA